MTKRISIKKIEPDAYKAMIALEDYTKQSDVPVILRQLIKIRASILNGCAYCVDMHTGRAIAEGESQRRIFALPVWKESHLFTKEERAVLQFTEELTLLSDQGVTDKTYKDVLDFYGKNILAQIIMLIVVINSWNRIMVATKMKYK